MQNSIVTRGYRFMMMRSADHFGEILEVVTENARVVATIIFGMEPEYRVVTHIDA